MLEWPKLYYPNLVKQNETTLEVCIFVEVCIFARLELKYKDIYKPKNR